MVVHTPIKLVAFFVFPLTGLLIGKYLDDQETLRMTRFRDKSALYGRTLGPGESPTWP